MFYSRERRVRTSNMLIISFVRAEWSESTWLRRVYNLTWHTICYFGDECFQAIEELFFIISLLHLLLKHLTLAKRPNICCRSRCIRSRNDLSPKHPVIETIPIEIVTHYNICKQLRLVGYRNRIARNDERDKTTLGTWTALLIRMW